MKHKRKIPKVVEPKRLYSPSMIIKMNLIGFPWKSNYTFIKKLNDPRWHDVFKPMVEQHDVYKTYKVKGANITKFLDTLERQTKPWQKRK